MVPGAYNLAVPVFYAVKQLAEAPGNFFAILRALPLSLSYAHPRAIQMKKQIGIFKRNHT